MLNEKLSIPTITSPEAGKGGGRFRDKGKGEVVSRELRDEDAAEDSSNPGELGNWSGLEIGGPDEPGVTMGLHEPADPEMQSSEQKEGYESLGESGGGGEFAGDGHPVEAGGPVEFGEQGRAGEKQRGVGVKGKKTTSEVCT